MFVKMDPKVHLQQSELNWYLQSTICLASSVSQQGDTVWGNTKREVGINMTYLGRYTFDVTNSDRLSLSSSYWTSLSSFA